MCIAFALLSSLVASSPALADAPSPIAPAPDAGAWPSEAAPPPPRPPWRRFGAGTLFGGGLDHGPFSFAVSDPSPVFTPPTLELRVFLPIGFSFDFASSLTGTLVAAGHRTFYWTQDVFFDFNIGGPIARFLVGPGIGFTAASGKDDNGASLRIPAELGIEISTDEQGFGFQLVTRPWLEATFGTTGSIGGGAVLLIGGTAYFSK